MSIELPPWLSWVATLAVGQHWPKGDEDGLRLLGEAWEDTAQQLVDISEEIGPATQGVLSNIGGSVATEFKSFVDQLQTNLPDMAQAAGQMGTLGKETGVQVEYAKYMILAQLAWLAVEIVDLSWWAPEAVPAAITAARVAVWMILRRLLTSIASGIGFMVGMDALIQAIQLLKGDRTHWDWQSTLSAVESGAIAGAIGGIIGEGAGHFAPGLAKNIIGKGIIGGATGVASSAALTGIFGGSNDFGEAFAGGAIGSMLGGGGRRGGEGPHVPKEETPDIHVPTAIDLHLPDANGIKPPAITIDHTPTESGLPTAPGSNASGSPTRSGANLGANVVSEEVPHTTGAQASATESAPNAAPHIVETPVSSGASLTRSEPPTASASAHNSAGLPGFETALGAQPSPSSRSDTTTTPSTTTTTTRQQASAPAEVAPRAPQAPVITPTAAPTVTPHESPSPATTAESPHSEQPSVTGVNSPTATPHVEQSAAPAQSASAPHEPIAPAAQTTPTVSPPSQQHTQPDAHPDTQPDTQPTVQPSSNTTSPAAHVGQQSHDVVPVAPPSREQQQTVGLPPETNTASSDHPSTEAPVIARPSSAPPALSSEERPTALPPTESSVPSTTAAPRPATTEPATAPTDAGKPTIETAPPEPNTPTRESATPDTGQPVGTGHGEPTPSPAAPTTATATTSSGEHNTPEPAPRTPPPTMKLDHTPRFVVRSGFDQRDFTHDGTPYTDLTVRIAFQGGDPADHAGTFDLAKQGVEQYYNAPHYQLPNGSQLHVTIEAVQPHEQPHLTVTLVGQDHGMDQRNWPPHASPISYAHEIGHQLGLRDEYQDPSNPYRAHVPGSLLGDYHSPSEHGLPQGGLGGRHLHLLGALTGGGAPAHPQPVHHPVGPTGSDEVTPRMPSGGQSASLHDHLPQNEWWKLYIDPKNHATAAEHYPENPGSFYDHDRSPGYQEGMVSAYTQFLGDPKAAHTPLDSGSYQTIHDLAVSNLGRDIGWSGGRPTHFPLRGMQLAPDIFHETVGGRPLVHDLATHDWSKPLTGPKPITITTNTMFNNHSLSTNYGRGQAPGLVDDVFQRHYDTVGQPGIDTGGKLGSIASTVRALHVIHPFEDGNLRTNVQIVLPKLLLEQGFRPVVPDDMYTIFQGGHSVDQMVESLVRNGATEGLPHADAPSSASVAPKAPVRPPDRVSPEEASDYYGMPKGNFNKFQQIAQQKGLVIDVRPTNPQSVKWLDQGMLPKPVDIKAKTINTLDTHLGADPGHQGLVGYFRPTMPTERPAGMDDGTWNSLQQRFDQRTHEFEQLAPKMQKLAAQGQFHVQDGLVKGYNADGQLTAITGDHDIFDITTPGGHTLTPTTYQHTIDEMIANNMAVAHGAHMYWPEPRSPFSQKIYEKIVTSHAEPNGEPLVRFRPGPAEQTGAELAWSRPEAGPPATTEATPHTNPEHQQPSWQDTRNQTLPIVRQHAWVDPVSDPTRTTAPDTPTPTHSPTTETPPEPVTHPAPTVTTDAPTPSEQRTPQLGTQQQHTPTPEAHPPTESAEPVEPADPTETVVPSESTAPTQPQGHQQEQPSPAHQHSETPNPPQQHRTTEPVEPTQHTSPTQHTPEQQPLQQPEPRPQPESHDEPAVLDAPVTPVTTEPERPVTPTPEPAPAPPPADARHQRSLAGLKITEAPGPDAVRNHINTVLGDHRTEQQVQQRLDVQLDPANFRTQHEQMVDGGWRFPISVGGRPHEVQVEAVPSPWRGTPGSQKDSADIEASSSSAYTPEPRKVDSTSTETGLDLAPSGVIPVNPHLNALVTGSVSVGGVSHGANTTVKSSTDAPNKVTLTGPTDNHTSTFTYTVRIVDDQGTPLPHPGDVPVLTGEVKADIPRGNPVTGDGPHTWNGWDPTPGAHPDGRPLTVTGLGDVRDAVFQHLPQEQRPEGLAHQPILDFLDPKNVVNGFEHASSWGLDSPPMTFSDGRTGYLRLTLHPQGSTIVDTVDHKSSLGAKSTTEYSGSRADSSSRALGASGGASGEVWASAHDKETKWLTGTAGYNYAASSAHQAKQSSTLTAQSSHEQSGTSHLVSTRVHFQVEVIKNHLSPGTDGTHDTRSQTIGLRDPLPQPEPNADHIAITMEHPIAGEALRVVPPAPAAHDPSEQPAPQPPSSADLRTPAAAQRTSFLDVPGSADLEQHIVAQLHQQAPGLLPPPRDATGGPHRVTPQAVENLRTLHQQLSPSALRGGGGRLLDGSYTISLDTSHLPGFPSRTYEVTVHAQLDHTQAAHLGNSPSTSKDSLGLKTGADKQIGHGGKHTVSLAGNFRSSLNPPDTGRTFLNANADGSYSSTHQVSTGTDSEVKREFSLESPADSFSYPVSYDVRIGPQGGTHTPTTVHPANGRPLVAEVRPAANPETPPPTHLPLTELPPAHLVSHVGNEDTFRQQAQTALTSAYEAKGGSRPPDLSTALDSLTGQHQLRGQVSSSHNSWSNTGTEHVGSGRNPDAVGLSTRTTLSGFTYRETLPGQGKLSVETKSGSSTTVVDKWSGGLKGGLGPDFVRYPENPQGLHESTYQVRGGFKGKLSLGRDGNDSVKTQVSTSHKTTTPKGTWHVYEATARVTTTGRVVDANGDTHYGRPQQSDHPVLVLLSNEDVQHLTAPGPPPATPPQRQAHLLDQGLSAGTVVNFHNTDGILHEIDAQLRGPQPNGEVPVRALPFANTFSPDNLSAHYTDLVGKGILDYHVQEGRSGRTITEVLVRGIPHDGHWRDEGRSSETDTTRTVTSSRTVKGNSGSSWSAGADANASASVRTPKAVDHLSNANYGPSVGGEKGRTSGAESGVTAKTEQKTAKFGPGLSFSNGMDFSVVVTQRTEYGRFVNLPKGPGTVPHPGRVTASVPESMTRPVDAPPLGTAQPIPAHTDEADAGVPGGIQLHPIAVTGNGDPGTDPLHWQQQLSSGHDVVGFDQTESLVENAGTALSTPRPWSDTFLGNAGRTSTTVLGTGAGWIGGALNSGAHAVLPKAMTDMAHRVVTSFVADPRLNTHPLGAEVQHEQRLPLDQRLGVRQVFSAQSLPSLLQQAKNGGTHYETVPLGTDGKTALQVSVTPTGRAEEVGTRPNGEDETTVTTEDASGTSATSTHSWSASPANFSLTTNKPLVTIPFNGPKLTGEGNSDHSAPVTRTPGQPSRLQPPAALPHGLTPGDPGKAEVKGPQSLMRQPVRVTVQKTDATGPYGAAVPTDGHLYYWAAKPATDNAPPEPLTPQQLRPEGPVPLPEAQQHSVVPVSRVEQPEPARQVTTQQDEQPPEPAAEHPTVQTTPPQETPQTTVETPPANPDRSLTTEPEQPRPVRPLSSHSAPNSPIEHPYHALATPTAGSAPSSPGTGHPPSGQPVSEHVIGFTSSREPGLSPDQLTAVDDTAAQLTALSALRSEHGEPPLSVTVNTFAAVQQNGVRHYGQSLSLATQRARSVAEALRAALASRGTDLPITVAPQVGGHPEEAGDNRAVLVVTGQQAPAPLVLHGSPGR